MAYQFKRQHVYSVFGILVLWAAIVFGGFEFLPKFTVEYEPADRLTRPGLTDEQNAFLTQFDEIVFETFGQRIPQTIHVQRDITVRHLGTAGSKHVADALSFADRLESETGIEIEIVGPEMEGLADVTIVFVEDRLNLRNEHAALINTFEQSPKAANETFEKFETSEHNVCSLYFGGSIAADERLFALALIPTYGTESVAVGCFVRSWLRALGLGNLDALSSSDKMSLDLSNPAVIEALRYARILYAEEMKGISLKEDVLAVVEQMILDNRY